MGRISSPIAWALLAALATTLFNDTQAEQFLCCGFKKQFTQVPVLMSYRYPIAYDYICGTSRDEVPQVQLSTFKAVLDEQPGAVKTQVCDILRADIRRRTDCGKPAWVHPVLGTLPFPASVIPAKEPRTGAPRNTAATGWRVPVPVYLPAYLPLLVMN